MNDEHMFYQVENRLQNYFIATAMGGSDKIKEPQDIYELPIDSYEVETVYTEKQIEFFNNTDEKDLEIIAKIG